MPFNLGAPELIVILAVALIVFGPKKLPDIGKNLGGALREFNKARNDFMASLNSEVHRDDYDTPSPTPTAASNTIPAPDPRRLEFPDPVEAGKADALPYGSDFQVAGAESQPAMRTVSSADDDRLAAQPPVG